MLSHKGYCAEIAGIQKIIPFNKDDIFFSIVPYHHNLGQIADFLMPLNAGASIGHCEGLQYVMKNMQELKPSVVSCSPAVAESFLKQIWVGLAKAGKKEQVEQLLSTSTLSIEQAREIFKDIHQAFGGNIRLFPCAGAQLHPEIEKGLRNFGIESAITYGLTETTAAVSISQPGNSKDNSVGSLLPGVEIKINEPNEEGIGEILAKWDGSMLGYYNDPEVTKKTITDDGFIRTGDLGAIDKDNFLYFSGRKKRIIVPKTGKKIFPEELEELLKTQPYIKESLVYGKNLEGTNDVVVAISIFPDRDKFTADFGDISEEEIKVKIQEQIADFNQILPPYKAIQYIDELRTLPFEKTPSGKIKLYGSNIPSQEGSQHSTASETLQEVETTQGNCNISEEER